ncbi:MAG TPA: DinB family protein, partial [Parvularculaceae bacterium]|nr:DinB family protein [Parvularculaceae bacterium]
MPSAQAIAASGKQAARERFARVRLRTLELAAPLTPEDQTTQSMPDASPTKWHLAHTSWFFETFVLSPYATDYAIFDPAFGYLFNSYYEAMGARYPRPARGMLSRPSLETIGAYRAHVDNAVQSLADRADAPLWEKVAPLIELGLHHEQQHQELLLMDVKHLFSLNPLQPSYGAFPPAIVRKAPQFEWISFEGGLHEIGHDGRGFAFDNESPRHKVWLEPFRLAGRLATNAEYQAFIADGGYHR